MITANQFFNQRQISTWEAYKVAVLAPEMVKRLIKEQGYDVTTPPLLAYVNHGYWRVKCECGSTEFAWEEGWFMCRSCYNGGHKHQYRKAVFPENRAEIEALLAVRPLQNRNWYPGETLAQLEAENQEHREELLK